MKSEKNQFFSKLSRAHNILPFSNSPCDDYAMLLPLTPISFVLIL